MRLLLITLLFTYLLSACGLKGPLYLPPADDVTRSSSTETEKK
ncbi:MAG: hypothetical protein E6Q62_05980 [Nitrosomonas sp.]|nr:MAG: hypothetical protein E6Q62_05980 [Nitrosomonas sp.]